MGHHAKPRKWFSIRTDLYGPDMGELGIYLLSPQAIGLWVTSVAYATRWNITYLHRNHFRMFARRSSKPIAELVEHGFLVEIAKDCFTLSHEGRAWRRGNANQGIRTPIQRSVRRLVMARDNYQCIECSSPDDLTIDHIWPHSKGGSDAPDNLRVLCRPCNSRKGDRV